MAQPSRMDNKENDVVVTELSDDEAFSQDSLKNRLEVPNQSLSLPSLRVHNTTPVLRVISTCPPSIERDVSKESEASRSDSHASNVSNDSESASISEHILEDVVEDGSDSEKSEQEAESSEHDDTEKSQSSRESSVDIPLDFSNSGLSDKKSDPPSETATPIDKSDRSNDVIKLDIRGQATQQNFSFANPLFNLTGPKKNIITSIKTDEDLMDISKDGKIRVPSPVIVTNPKVIDLPLHDESLTEDIRIDDVTDKEGPMSDGEQKDYLVEEIIINNSIDDEKNEEVKSCKSPGPNDNDLNLSLSTFTTEYRTFGDDYGKILDIPVALYERDTMIEKLTISLQESLETREFLQLQNEHLVSQLGDMQQRFSEATSEVVDVTRGQLSDFAKHESMLREDEGSDLSSAKEIFSDVADPAALVEKLKDEHKAELESLDAKHRKEVEDLRTYFERKCHDMEKQYSEEVFSQQSARRSSSSSGDSLDRCPEALPFGSPLHVPKESTIARDRTRKRSRSVDYLTPSADEIDELEKQKNIIQDAFELKYIELKTEHDSSTALLQEQHRKAISDLKDSHAETVSELKAHIQTLQNTEVDVTILNEDIDLELEKTKSLERQLNEVRQDVVHQLQDQIQALLGDPGADLSGTGCPVELSLLRDRIQADTHAHYERQIEQMKKQHEEELSSLRSTLDSTRQYEGSNTDKWRQKRQDSFDKNRHLDEVIKERDGLAQLSKGLQRVLRQLVGYFSACEDEVNNTILEELLKQHLDITSSSESTIDRDLKSEPASLNTSLVESEYHSKRSSGKRVHFAPDVDSIISQFDPDCVLDIIEKQADVSVEIQNELDACLNRLKHEAQVLLAVSSKLGAEQQFRQSRLSDVFAAGDSEKLFHESDLKEEIELLKKRISELNLDNKVLKQEINEGIQRENLLKSELQLARSSLAEHVTKDDVPKSDEVVTEGYGICLSARASRPPRTPRSVQSPRTPRSDSRHHSLDSVVHGQHYSNRSQDLNTELETMSKERDDLKLQLEQTNRLLRSTREFLDDQTAERESERDQYHNSVTVLKEEIARLHAKLQCNSTIVSEDTFDIEKKMSLLETQMRDTTNAITELENRKCETEANLQTALDKISVLREIICNLEGQLEEKIATEENLLKDLDQLRILCEEKDVKIRDLQDDYDALKQEMEKTSAAADPDPASGDSERENDQKLITNIKAQLETLESAVSKRTSALERLYDKCLHSNSEPSEDVSLADHRQRSSVSEEVKSDHWGEGIQTEVPVASSPRRVLYRLSEGLSRHYRADEAALKRIQDLEMQLGQLRDVAQEVRLERDALQQRLSEQALRVSSLQARLDAQRHAADALWRDVQEKAAIQLHDAHAELQATKEALENREKQLTRLKTIVGEDGFRKHTDESGTFQEEALSKLQRELSKTKAKVEVGKDNAEDQTDDDLMLQLLAERNADIELLKDQLAERDQLLLDKEQQLNELMALKLEDEQQQDESENEVHNEANKNSARTLSDIISISEYDESDLQVRKAELRHQDTSNIFMQLSGENVKGASNTLPPRSVEQIEFANGSPRFDLAILRDSKRGTGANSLPNLESSTKHITANKSNSLMDSYKRNVNETVMFGVSLKNDKHSTAHQVDNSIAPNREASLKKPTVEPKRINFSTPSSDNFVLDYDQKIYPDVLTQLKSEISRLNAELTNSNAALNSALEKLEVFNAVQSELEEAQCLLRDSINTINTDKKYYNEQIETFKTVEDDLKKRLEYAVIQANEKSSDLQVLKQDILKRENMVLDLAKEKRTIQQRLDEMELRLEVLQNKADLYESACTENERIRLKLQDLQNIEELVSEKNIQIDSLNEHLDRLDNLQRKLEEKDEQLETLKAEILSKSTEINRLKELSGENAVLKEKLTKLEKEQENIQVKERAVEKREKDIEKTLEINSELSAKIEEMKQLNERLKDKEYEVEILNEDISAFHIEIDSLKEQLASRSPSPSPRDSSGKKKLTDSPSRQATNDKRELGKITKQVIQLQNELGGNKKELNNKVLELELAKLEIIKLRNELEAMRNFILEKDGDIRNLATESNALKDQLQAIVDKIREDGNLEDLRQKLQSKCNECLALEREVEVLKEVMERMRSQSPMDNSRLAILAPGDTSALACMAPSRSSRRLSINEIEERLKQELDTSQKLDETLLDQILADREKADDESNQYEIGKRNFPISSEHIVRLMSDNEHLKKQVSGLEDRIRDKDILVQELNSIREGLMRDLQIAEARTEDERDNGERLQLLLESERNTTKNLQEQDCNIIHVLKSRLESALDSKSEVESSFREEQEMRKQLDKQLKSKRGRGGGDDAMKELEERLEDEIEKGERLLSEVQLLKAKRISDKERMVDMQHILDREKSTFQLQSEKNTSSLNTLKAQLVEMRRKERAVQSELDHTRAQLQLRVTEVNSLQHRMSRIKNHEGRSYDNAMTELIEQNSKLNKQKVELINEMHLMKEKFLKHTRKEPQTYTSTTVLNIHDDADDQVRHLYSCYIRVESFRKALVHQKKFLLRSLGPHSLFTQLQVNPRKKKSFRSVVIGIMAISRMRYLVRRWHSGRKLVDVLFSKVSAYPAEKKPQQTSRTTTQQSGRYHVSSSPPCRERSSARRSTAGDTSASMLGAATTSNNPLQPNADNIVYRDVLGVYSNPELFSATITINDMKRNESRQTEDETTRLHSPLNVDSSALLSHYLQRLDRSAKLVKKSLDTPRSTH